jgi:DNA end-binding protein Ku
MRSLWNGSLSFGVVTSTVKLYSATEDHDVSFHQVHAADGGRIRYQRVCEVCGNVVEYRDIAKSYENADGQSVILTDEDFATLPADRSREIAVQEFVPAEQIDPMLFDRSYYVEPAAAAAKAYVLLRRTLESTDRVAVVRFALRQRTQLGALRVHGDVLAVQTMRWPDEIREFEVPDRVREATVTDREMQMAATLVDSYATDFQPEEFTDEYQVQLKELIDAKLEGGEAFVAEEPAAEGEDAEVVDLLAALERSVARRGGAEQAATGTEGRKATTGGRAGSSKAGGDGKSGSTRKTAAKSGTGRAKGGSSAGGSKSGASRSKAGSAEGDQDKPRARKRA